jgi:hypothetical protein
MSGPFPGISIFGSGLMELYRSWGRLQGQKSVCAKKPAFAEEEPGESLPSLPRLPHRKPSMSIGLTSIHHPLPCVIRFAVLWRRSVSLPEAATAQSCAASPRTGFAPGVLPLRGFRAMNQEGNAV